MIIAISLFTFIYFLLFTNMHFVVLSKINLNLFKKGKILIT